MRHATWWIAAVLTMLGDVVTTWVALTWLPESFMEANPVVLATADIVGLLPALVGLKLLLVALMVVLYRYETADEQWHVPAICAGLHGAVVATNTVQIFVVA